jgi:hypothetical protein
LKARAPNTPHERCQRARDEVEIIHPDGGRFSACIGTPTVFSTFDQ